jgi:hypothetical protein
MSDQSKARPFFAAYQTRQHDAAAYGKPDKTIFNSFSDTPESAVIANAITVAQERAEDVLNGRSQQFPGLARP